MENEPGQEFSCAAAIQTRDGLAHTAVGLARRTRRAAVGTGGSIRVLAFRFRQAYGGTAKRE